MFYFGFTAGSFQELQENMQLLLLQPQKAKEVEGGGVFLACLWPPRNFKHPQRLADALLGVRDYSQELWQKAWGLLLGGKGPQCLWEP